ncbi:MAG: molybdopterin-guanine dinucleotide biosynthesis protein B [Alphaproteobacteria bacterium]
MKIFGLAGWSGAGKTSLIVRLLPELVGRGITVSTMKHAHHAFDIDQPGKDSHEHRQAGATEVLVTSANRWALMHELRGAPEASVEALIAHMTPADLLIIEGFKDHVHDKLEVFRRDVGKPLLCISDPCVVAVASDAPVPEARVPVIDLGNTRAIADFIVAHCGLTRGRARGVA